MIKIAVDAMGGDNSPKKIIDGVIHQHNKNKDIFYKLFGNEEEIIPIINNRIDKKFFRYFSSN